MNPSWSKMALPREVRAYLEEQPAPERAALEEAWDAAGEARPPAAVPDAARKAAVWAVLEAALDAPDARPLPAAPAARPARPLAPAPERRPALRLVRPATMRWLAAAAVAVVLFGAGLAYWTRPVTLTAPNGTTRLATLPDGSRVELNSGSALTYARSFGERHVRLEGEAFFEVEHDAARPFVVETFNAHTTVLGTSFNVRARRTDPAAATSVTVATGRVALAPKDAPEAGVVLTPALKSTLAAGTQAPTAPDSVQMNHAFAWRSGGFHFDNQPFGVVFGEIGRRYNVLIETSEDIALRPAAFYKHDPAGAEAVLRDLTMATGLRYRKTANGFEVYAP